MKTEDNLKTFVVRLNIADNDSLSVVAKAPDSDNATKIVWDQLLSLGFNGMVESIEVKDIKSYVS